MYYITQRIQFGINIQILENHENEFQDYCKNKLRVNLKKYWTKNNYNAFESNNFVEKFVWGFCHGPPGWSKLIAPDDRNLNFT